VGKGRRDVGLKNVVINNYKNPVKYFYIKIFLFCMLDTSFCIVVLYIIAIVINIIIIIIAAI